VKRSLNQRLLIGVAVLAVLAGGTMAAVTAARGPAHRAPRGPLAVAASYLGVPATQLQGELRSGKSLAQIANATGGRSASGLIDALVASGRARLAAASATLPTRATALVDRAGGPAGARLPSAASYLGLKPAELRGQLRAGKSLAQIAAATSGKSVAGLIETLVTARKATLAARVSAGAITQVQADARLATLTKRVTAAVNRTRPPKPASRRPTG
jgi:hypothetical protein